MDLQAASLEGSVKSVLKKEGTNSRPGTGGKVKFAMVGEEGFDYLETRLPDNESVVTPLQFSTSVSDSEDIKIPLTTTADSSEVQQPSIENKEVEEEDKREGGGEVES